MIRPSALGDVCRSVPVLASLKAAFPKAKIDWLVQDSFLDAVRHHPLLNEAVPFPRKSISAELKRLNFSGFRALCTRLRQGRYELVLDCQGLFRSGLFARVTGARRRVGYSNARELGWLFMTERHHVDIGMHSVDRMLELVSRAGAPPVRDMRLYTGTHDREWAGSLGSGPLAVIAPTSRWNGKRWPAERFAEVAGWLLSQGLERVCVVGAASERTQIEPVLNACKKSDRIVDLVGATSVGKLMSLIERSSLVIANDSAALHMAVGFDRPAVALYGPTETRLVGPYVGHHPERPAAVVQRLEPGDVMDHKDDSAGARMMARIDVDSVKAAVMEVLGRKVGTGVS